MKFQNRLLLAQLAPLVPLLLTGLLAVAALWTMTSSVQQARALQVRRMVTAADAVGTFREEYALLERYAETGDLYYLDEARLRSQLLHTRVPVISQDEQHIEHLGLLLGEYEALAGFSGPPGDRGEAQRAARAMVQELELRHSEFRVAMQADLRTVAQTGRTTGAFIIFMVGLVLVLGGWVSYVVARDLSSAMRELERGTRALTAGDFEYRIELERQDEFGELASAFDRMAGRIAELDRMKIDFFANVSHDLKTPLTSMSEATALLSEEVAGPLSADQRALVSVLESDVRRLRGLVATVLDLSRLGSGQAELTPGDVRATIRTVVSELELLATQRSVSLVFRAPEELPRVVVNKGMVDQVLMNLVGNALKFSPHGGTVTVEASLREGDTWVRRGDRAVLITVEDEGPGVPEVHRKRIFERFFQAPDQEHRGGTGLGLYICREIVDTHGGRIWVEEAQGGGARFCFTLVPGQALPV